MSLNPTPSLPPASVSQSTVETGMILMALSALMAPGGHTIAKGLGESLSPGQIAWARFFFQFAFLAPVVWFAHGRQISWPSLSHVIRGLLLAATTLFFFWALSYMPLPTCAAIFFVEPLILTLISAVFLGEPIGWRRLSAVAIGFAGALIVIRPSFGTVGFAALLPLLVAVCFACFLVMTRHHAGRETPLMAQFWMSLFSAIGLSSALAIGSLSSVEIFTVSWPTPAEWGLLTAMAFIALICNRLAIRAIRLAPASVLAPLQYLEIFGSILFSAIVFGDIPDRMTGFGTAIIIISGLYVFRREQQLARGG